MSLAFPIAEEVLEQLPFPLKIAIIANLINKEDKEYFIRQYLYVVSLYDLRFLKAAGHRD